MHRLLPLVIATGLAIAFHAELWNAARDLLAIGSWEERYGWALILPVTYILGMLLLRDNR